MVVHSLCVPTICSISPNPNPNPNPNPFRSSSPHPQLVLRFRTTYRENLRYLKTLGIISNDNNNTNKFFSSETLDRILSIVNFLKSKGFSDHHIQSLSFRCPKIFFSNIDPTEIDPVLEFLTVDLSASRDETCGLILRCPEILFSDVRFCLRPTLLFLRELGLEKLNSPTSLNAHLLNTRVPKLVAKIRFLESLGLSYEESSRICARLPAIFGYSVDNNLRPKIEYLVEEMDRSIDELKVFPQYFAFSLERRIVPRHLHLKERNVQVPLQRMLLWSDQKFYTKWK
ncbi:Mitochodrial transcription termination factor-related [Macleaya cordata]|uniref:Mitochodrial transcription termination factor-related n=1 Tax=Macleaya cordata TaxID=56857 RepID=A0A200Q260_MACCD|nr:Mitochodrial transcription termination factor-related [Macleaya cordata]